MSTAGSVKPKNNTWFNQKAKYGPDDRKAIISLYTEARYGFEKSTIDRCDLHIGMISACFSDLSRLHFETDSPQQVASILRASVFYFEEELIQAKPQENFNRLIKRVWKYLTKVKSEDYISIVSILKSLLLLSCAGYDEMPHLQDAIDGALKQINSMQAIEKTLSSSDSFAAHKLYDTFHLLLKGEKEKLSSEVRDRIALLKLQDREPTVSKSQYTAFVKLLVALLIKDKDGYKVDLEEFIPELGISADMIIRSSTLERAAAHKGVIVEYDGLGGRHHTTNGSQNFQTKRKTKAFTSEGYFVVRIDMPNDNTQSELEAKLSAATQKIAKCMNTILYGTEIDMHGVELITLEHHGHQGSPTIVKMRLAPDKVVGDPPITTISIHGQVNKLRLKLEDCDAVTVTGFANVMWEKEVPPIGATYEPADIWEEYCEEST